MEISSNGCFPGHFFFACFGFRGYSCGGGNTLRLFGEIFRKDDWLELTGPWTVKN